MAVPRAVEVPSPSAVLEDLPWEAMDRRDASAAAPNLAAVVRPSEEAVADHPDASPAEAFPDASLAAVAPKVACPWAEGHLAATCQVGPEPTHRHRASMHHPGHDPGLDPSCRSPP